MAEHHSICDQFNVESINTGKHFLVYNYQNYSNQPNFNFTTQEKIVERPLDHESYKCNQNNYNNIQIFMNKRSVVEVIVKQDTPYEKSDVSSVCPNITISTKETDAVQEIQNDTKEQEKKKKSRPRHEENWKRNRIKLMRNSGQSYVNWRNKEVAERTLKPPCGEHCKMKCRAKFNDDERQEIFTNYWALGDINRQRDFIACFVCFMKKKRQRRPVQLVESNTLTSGHEPQLNNPEQSEQFSIVVKKSRRTMTYVYNLPKYDLSVKVCKVFFLNTLSISHQVVKTVASKYSLVGKHLLLSDQRGKQCREKYPDSVKDLVRQHIMKFVVVDNTNKKKSNKLSTCSGISSNMGESEKNSDLESARAAQKKKRERHEENWKRNRIKTMRNSGKSYVNWRNKPVAERTLKSPCEDQCKLKCKWKFTDEQRFQIFKDYWDLGDVNRQRFFIARFVNFTKTKNQRRLANKTVSQPTEISNVKEESRRLFTYLYNLPLDGEVIRVCKVFFLNTLCISHQVVKTVAAKCAQLGKCTVIADQRGKRKSDQNRADGNKTGRCKTIRNYMPASCTISKMYSIYKKECEDNNISTIATPYIYKKIFTQQLEAKKFIIKKEPNDQCSEYNLNNDLSKGDKKSISDVKPEQSVKETEQVVSFVEKKPCVVSEYHNTNPISKENYMSAPQDVYVDHSYLNYNIMRDSEVHHDINVNQCRQDSYWPHQYMPY